MTTDDAPLPPDTVPRGTVESSPERYAWTPPLTAAATAARRQIRLGSAVLIGLAAVWAATSVWSDGLDAVVFALIVPLLLVAIAVGIDRLFAVGSGFRVEVGDQVLTLARGGRRDRVDADDIVAVSVVSKTAGVRSPAGQPGWYVVIDRADGESLSALVPVGIGSAFGRSEANALEGELRRRLQR